MKPPLELEFVLMTNDYATLGAISGGVKKYGGKYSLVPSAAAARECLELRKIDGVFVDVEVPGAVNLIHAVRHGTSNCKVVIFACVPDAKQSTAVLNAGANFLLRKPVTVEGVALHLTIAKDLLLRERQRYFRQAVNLQVTLREGEREQRARISNVSEGGMAVRLTRAVKPGAALEFSFSLPSGAAIAGNGEVMWSNSEGMAGILFQNLHRPAKERLETWLLEQERISQNAEAAE
jgi:response regulator RpfG family c-di-GMP phosphodiesterase